MIKKISYFLGFGMIFMHTNLYACLDKDIYAQGMLLNPIGKQSILNGSSVDMYDLVSRDCNLECYAKFLDKNNVKFSKQGVLFYIEKKGGITIQVLNNNESGFDGRLICKAKKDYKKLALPSYFKIKGQTTDFQTTDNKSTSRTLSYPKVNRTVYLSLIKTLKSKSNNVDINNAFSYFELNDKSEFNLVFDMRRNTGNLVVVYVRNGN